MNCNARGGKTKHTMAIVKANYTKERERVKATIRLIERKGGKDALFGFDGLMERQWAYEMIDEAEKGSTFFRFLISPDPKTEDTHKDLFLREIAQCMMLALEERLDTSVSWVAATHNDQTYRHVHIVAVIPKRLHTRKQMLPIQDLQAMRLAATQAALEQRKWRDHMWEKE